MRPAGQSPGVCLRSPKSTESKSAEDSFVC
jgi:hypothetical protein